MPLKNLSLLSFEDQMLLGEHFAKPGSLPWLLRDFADLLFPTWLWVGWKGQTKWGRNAWPAPVLMALLLLRHSEAGMSRVGAVRKAASDAMWRAALQLPWKVKPPSEKTVREFEAFLKKPHPEAGLPRYEVFFEHVTRLCLGKSLVGDAPVWVADSTPMWCFGAVLGTVRLLGDGLRSLGKLWARARGIALSRVAAQWEAQLLLAKSTKGYFAGMDWADAKARSEVLQALMSMVTRAVQMVQAELPQVRSNKHKMLLRRCRNLLRVIDEDLESTEDGGLRVVQRRSSKRQISVTEPDAQHFRKSKSKVCSGFKLHALGDAVSGLVLSLSVTPGRAHDSTQLSPLLARAKALYKDIEEVIADAAYGGMKTRKQAQQTAGVRVLAPPVGNSRKGKGLGKEDFDIDFETMVATCPGGVVTEQWKWSKRDGEQVPMFVWEKGSQEHCGCQEACPVHKPRKRRGGKQGAPHRRLLLHPDEQDLRNTRANWQQPQTRARYRRRAEGERLMRELTRRGARHAGAWGLENARLQVNMAGSVSNLLILAKHLAAQRGAQKLAA